MFLVSVDFLKDEFLDSTPNYPQRPMHANPNPANVPIVDNTLVVDPAGVTEIAMRAGFRKTHVPLLTTCIRGVLGGMFVCFGAQTLVAILVDSGSTGPAKVLAGANFAYVLTLIIQLGGELFTGNIMILMAVLARRVYMWEYLTHLVAVFLTNFLGTIIFSIIFWGTGVNGFDGAYTAAGTIWCSSAHTKATLPHYQAFLRGIGANMCVCFGVLMAHSSKTPTGKVLGCLFPVAGFVVMGLEHSIANTCFYAAATLLRCPNVTQGDMWGELFLCTTGNIVGAGFLAISYYVVNIRGTKLQLLEVPHEEEEVRGGLKFMPASSIEEVQRLFPTSAVPNGSVVTNSSIV